MLPAAAEDSYAPGREDVQALLSKSFTHSRGNEWVHFLLTLNIKPNENFKTKINQ